MTIRDIAIAFGYEVDKKSEQKVEQSINNLKSMAKSALSAIGVGLSLVKINAIVEEFTQVNRQLKSAVGEVENFAKVQDQVLKAANDTRVSYSTMSTYVKGLMNSQNSLFESVDSTLQFAELTNKALKAAGANESTIASLNNGIQSAFVNGKLSAGTFQSLIASCPETVDYLSKTLGVSERQVRALGTAGAITSNQLYTAFTSNAKAIDQAYQKTSRTITEALTYMKNGFGAWLYEMNETLQVTKTISNFLVRGFDAFLGVLKKVTSWVDKLNKKLGGAHNTLKLIAIVGGSLYATMNAGKILTFLKSATKLLNTGSLKIMLIAAAVMVLAVLVEDFINFLKGNNSVFGEVLSSLGLNAEEVRDTLVGALNDCKEALGGALKDIMGALKSTFEALKPALKVLMELFVKLVVDILPVLCDLLSTIVRIVAKVLEAVLPVLGEILSVIIEQVSEFIEKLLPPIIDLINMLLPMVEQLVDEILPIVVKLLEALLPILSNLLSAILGPLLDILQAVISAVGKIVEAIFPVLIELLNLIIPLLDVIIELLLPIIDLVLSLIGPLLQMVSDILKPILDLVVALISPLLQLVMSILRPILEIVTALLKPLLEIVTMVLKPIIGILKSVFAVIGPIVEILTELLGGILQPIIRVITALTDVLGGAFSKTISTVTKILEPLLKVLSKIMDIITKLLGGALKGVTDAIGGVVKGAVNLIGNAAKGIGNAVSGIVKGAGNLVSKAAKGVGGAVKSVAKGVGKGVKKAVNGVKNFLGLAEGGYVDANSPQAVVIGDNTKEGEIVSPISKMRNTVLDALRLFASSNAPNGASSTLRNESSNRSITQNVTITNQFNGGSAEQQRSGAKAMKKSAHDATGIMARGLVYAR